MVFLSLILEINQLAQDALRNEAHHLMASPFMMRLEEHSQTEAIALILNLTLLKSKVP